MANNLINFKKEIWDRKIQRTLNKSLVALPLARFAFTEVTGATRFHRPAQTRLYATQYTAETPMTTQALGSVGEYLDVDQTRAVPFYIDATQKLESAYDIYNIYAPEAVYALRNEMDGKFFAEVVHAFYTVGKKDIEGSGANTDGITSSTSNIVKTLSFGKAKLVQNRVETTTPFYVVLEPTIAAIWEQTLASTGYQVGDTTLRNGYVTTMGALGLDLYVSNNLRHTITLTATKNFAEDDAVTIGTQTFVFKASPTTAGHVDLGVNLAGSLTNLAKAVNKGAGAGTDYIELTQDERAKLSQNLIQATADATTIVFTTAGYVQFVEAVDSGTAYSFGEHQCLSPLAQKGATDMVIQKNVVTNTQDATSVGLIGMYVTSWTKYGIKTFTEGKQRMVALRFKMN